MRIAQLNYVFDADLTDPDALLARYSTLTGWSEALHAASDHAVTVVQRFNRDLTIERSNVTYVFCADGDRRGGPVPVRPHRLHRAVVAAAPDVVHVNGIGFAVQTWFLRRSLPQSTAIVVQDHGSGPPFGNSGFQRSAGVSVMRRLHRFVRSRAMRSVDAFFFTAASMAEPWQKAGLITVEQLVYQIAESSTSLERMWRSLARRESEIDGDPALLWVGRLNANKDPLTAIDAFERVLPALPTATLSMIYSEGELLPAVRDRVSASIPLTRRVRLIGRVPHERMAAFYSAADIFVLGSHHEVCGYALLEACACGLAPAVTDIPPFRVMTNNGAIGALWPPGDADRCAEAIRTIARRDRPVVRERVLEHFERSLSWSAVATAAANAYNEVQARRLRERA